MRGTRQVLAALLAALLVAAVAPAAAHAARDQIVISGSVVVRPGETVHDVVVVDGPVRVAGRVTGEVVAVSGTVLIAPSGVVKGSVNAAAGRITLASGARVDGDVRYGDKRPVIAPGASVGGKVSNENWGDWTRGWAGVVSWLALWLAFTVSSLLFGLLLLWLAPRAMDAAWRTARERVGPAIGWGLGLFFGLPVVAIVLVVTLVGIPLGLAVLLALLPLAALGYTTSAWLLGRSAVRAPQGRVLAFLVGWGILRVLALVPWLGGLTWFAATAFGLGVLTVAVWRARGTAPAASAPSLPAPAG